MIPGLEKKDAQRIVYSTIIRDLEKRGFEVRILLENTKTVLYIAWVTDLDAQEAGAMTSFIAAKRISSEEIKVFVETGFAKAPNSATAVRTGLAPSPPRLLVTEKGRVMKPRGGLTTAQEEAAARVKAHEGGNTVGLPGKASAAEADLIGIVADVPGSK